VGCALAAGIVLAASGVHAQLRSPAPLPAPLQDEAAWALAVQYEQYLLYLSLATHQGTQAPDYGQYFSNGAAVTSVPSAGQPGSAYFTNGAEATLLPLAAPTALAPLPAPPEAAPSAASSTRETPEPMPTSPTSPIPAAAGAVVRDVWVEGPPMSFEEWLRSMGATTPGAEGARPAPTVAAAGLTVAEPAASANDARQRTSFAPAEKPSERVVVSGEARRLAVPMACAFALGVLLGVLAMLRDPRRRRRSPS
jgi:hypothetical protein